MSAGQIHKAPVLICTQWHSRRVSLFFHDFTAWFSHDFWMVALKAAPVSALRFQFHFGLQ